MSISLGERAAAVLDDSEALYAWCGTKDNWRCDAHRAMRRTVGIVLKQGRA
ncbi:hypothetical protein [Streptomyces roseifaciens]|uniref:hypothetical protein n=1 Tax=Streptomyces roseifaciens TaxID=1488406 RepID=UPI001C1F72B5|nr:hypothetical protein [Streptomyces roseifaciens]